MVVGGGLDKHLKDKKVFAPSGEDRIPLGSQCMDCFM